MTEQTYRVSVSAGVAANPTVVKRPDGTVVRYDGQYVTVEGVLEIDVDLLAHELLRRAVTTKNRSSELAGGLIKCRLTPKSKEATWTRSEAARLGHVAIEPFKAQAVFVEGARIRYQPMVWVEGAWEAAGELDDYTGAIKVAADSAADRKAGQEGRG